MIFEIGLPRKICFSKKEATDFINSCNGTKAIYKTVYNFDSIIENKIDYNSAIIDKLFFDFDEGDCWDEVNRFHKFLIKEDIKHKLVMSGNGYHVFVMTNIYRPKNSKSCIKNAQHYFIDKLDLKCDRQIVGDNARLCRIPNTYHTKAKRFCIPLTKLQFQSGDTIIKIVAQKQNLVNEFIGETLFDITQFDTEPENISKLPLILNSGSPDYMKDCPEFIQRLLIEKELGWEERYLVILFFKEKGYMREEVFEILKKHLSERKFKHCVGEERQLQYLFERDDLVFPEKYGKIYK